MKKNLNLRSTIVLGFIIAFLVNTFGPLPLAQAQDFRLPAPGVMVHLSPEFNPPILKGIKVHPDNPFRFDFILDKGDSQLSNDALKDESSKLIKYFLASLTIPEKDLWVNLSPYEKDRIIPNSFGLTEMGRDLLAEDYMLKQITASLIYPEDEVGKRFWKRIYEEAAKKFGTTNIPVNTFNKVWILPEKAVVYENAKAGTAYVVESKLKVMLEEDYLSLSKNTSSQPGGSSDRQNCRQAGCQANKALNLKAPQGNHLNDDPDINRLGSQIIREIVIPQLIKEVNEGKNFAQLRQVYNSLILATWYKKKIKDSILSQVYADKNKTAGVNTDDPQEKQKIYERYLQAFKKGVYNYIKEETLFVPGMPSKEQGMLPRKYFSGGAVFIGRAMDAAMTIADNMAPALIGNSHNLAMITANADPVGQTPAGKGIGLKTYPVRNLKARGGQKTFEVTFNNKEYRVEVIRGEEGKVYFNFYRISNDAQYLAGYIYTSPLVRHVYSAIRGIEVKSKFAVPGMARFMVSVFLEQNPRIEYTHPDLRNAALMRILIKDFGFLPPSGAKPNAYYLEGDDVNPAAIQKLGLPSGVISKGQRVLISRNDFNGLYIGETYPSIQGQYVVTDGPLDALAGMSGATPLYLGYELKRDRAMNIDEELANPRMTKEDATTVTAIMAPDLLGKFNSVRYIRNLKLSKALSNFLLHGNETAKAALQYNFAFRTADVMLYYILLEAIGLPLDKARSMGFEKLMLLWCQYVRTGDTILDTYGKLFSMEELHMMLDSGDNFPIVPKRSLIDKGILEAELINLKVKTIPEEDRRNRAEILSNFNLQADDLISRMPLSSIEQRKVKGIFVAVSKRMFASYILERRYGLYPTVEQTLEIIQAKSVIPVLVNLREVFRAGSDAKETAQFEAFLLNFNTYLQMWDDFGDLAGDYGVQPNLILSIAKQYYPEEFVRLERWLAQGRVIGGLKSLRELLNLIPNTYRRWLSVTYSYFKEIFIPRPIVSSMATLYVAYYILLNKGGATKANQAMMPGGIDLAPADKVLQSQNAGEGIKFHLDPAMLAQLQNAPGFMPVIINIQPLKSLPEFLGLK